MTKPTTLRNIVGLPDTPPALADSALVLIDCQNTYREGIMALSGVEAALDEASRLLAAARKLGVPVFHIQHDAGPGSPYDISQPIGAIADKVAPAPGTDCTPYRPPCAWRVQPWLYADGSGCRNRHTRSAGHRWPGRVSSRLAASQPRRPLGPLCRRHPEYGQPGLNSAMLPVIREYCRASTVNRKNRPKSKFSSGPFSPFCTTSRR